MLLALDKDNMRRRATPKARGLCPACKTEVTAKCGVVKVHHWSHKRAECDSWSEPESKWHLRWKEIFGFQNCEIVIGNHRADIVGNGNTVIELQHSSISGQVVAEREQFYKNMAWLVDANPFSQNFILRKDDGKNFAADWFWARKVWTQVAKAPVFLHVWNKHYWHNPKRLLLITYASKRGRVDGTFVSIDEFLEMYKPSERLS